MGAGYCYFCKKFGKEFSLSYGYGMMFPSAYKELLADIRAVGYGEEMKEASLSNSNVAVDAERHLYVCSCGHWESAEGLSLFVPKDGVLLKRPYVMPYELKNHYRNILEYIHKCPECGKQMNEADDQPVDLRCPVCKTLYSYRDELDWD